MRRGGRPAQGGTPATFAHRWPGHWQARPPHVGGLPPCAGLALALPAGATAGTPARRRRSPRPAARECAGRRRLRRQCARRSKLRPPAGARAAAAARSRGPGSAGGRHPPARGPGPLRRAASAEAEPCGTASAVGVAGLARLAGAPPTGPEGRTAPKPPRVGAGPPRSTCAATGAGEEQCKAGPLARPAGAWPCIAEGCPRATAGGQLDQDAPQARPWPPHFPGQTPQGAGRGGRRHSRRTGWAGCRPAGRRGGWDVARPQAGRGREPLSPGR
jgi:hypothetical protein